MNLLVITLRKLWWLLLVTQHDRVYRVMTLLRLRTYAALYLVATYLLGVFTASAWSDDYPAVYDPSGTALHATKDARPLAGLLIYLGFNVGQGLTALLTVRILGLIGLILLSDLVLRELLKKELSYKIAVASCIAFTLPAFQFWAHWGMLFTAGWAAYFSVLGFVKISKSGRSSLLIGLLLVTTSWLIYPPVSFFVVVFVFSLSLVSQNNLLLMSKSLIKACGYLISGGLIGTFSSLIFLYAIGVSRNARVSIVAFSDLPEKAVWFFTRPFLLSFRPFLIDSPTPGLMALQVSFSVGLLFLLAYLHYRSAGYSAKILSLVFTNLVVCLLPLLIVRQNQIDLRLISGNSWLYLFLIVYFGLSAVEKNSKSWVGLRYEYLLAISILMIGFFTVNDRYLSFIHPIYSSNQIFFEKELQLCNSTQLKNGVEIVRRSSSWPSKPLLGLYSQSTDLESEWVPVLALQNYFESTNQDSYGKIVLVDQSSNSEACKVFLDKFPPE